MNNELKPIKPCSYCGSELYLEIDNEGGGVTLYHAKDTGCIIPDIETIGDDVVLGTTLNDLVDRINVRPIEDALLTRAEAAEQKLRELQDRTRWIPVSERLPEDTADVLVLLHDKAEVAWFNTLSKQFGYLDTDWVTHWQPLPDYPDDEPEAENDTA